MTWISYRRYREMVPLFFGDHPMVDVAYSGRSFAGHGPTVRIRTPGGWLDWGEAQFSLEDVNAWLAWDSERRLRAL